MGTLMLERDLLSSQLRERVVGSLPQHQPCICVHGWSSCAMIPGQAGVTHRVRALDLKAHVGACDVELTDEGGIADAVLLPGPSD